MLSHLNMWIFSMTPKSKSVKSAIIIMILQM